MSQPATCHCGLWESSPGTLRSQGVPEGFCGICDVCGAPGHVRAHPAAPVSGAWCDACYSNLATGNGVLIARAVPWIALSLGMLAAGVAVWRSLA